MTEPRGSWTGVIKPSAEKSGTNSVTVSSSQAYLIQPMGRTWQQSHLVREKKHYLVVDCGKWLLSLLVYICQSQI